MPIYGISGTHYLTLHIENIKLINFLIQKYDIKIDKFSKYINGIDELNIVN